MTKEQFLDKWRFGSNPPFESDLDAVIAHEIAKAKEPQPALNPIAEAYELGEKIRKKTWEKDAWIKKHTEIMSIHDDACLRKKVWYNFDTYPNLWELYTEPTEQVTDQVTDQEPDQVAEPTEQPSSQAKLDNSFDKERFERIFCSMVAREPHWAYNYCIIETEKALAKLDAYYAEKEGGENE